MKKLDLVVLEEAFAGNGGEGINSECPTFFHHNPGIGAKIPGLYFL
jgi:hypothetical protein